MTVGRQAVVQAAANLFCYGRQPSVDSIQPIRCFDRNAISHFTEQEVVIELRHPPVEYLLRDECFSDPEVYFQKLISTLSFLQFLLTTSTMMLVENHHGRLAG